VTVHPALQKLIDRIGVPVERGAVQAGTVRTAYLAAGQGEPLVLLHGGSSAGVSWYPVIAPLSAHYRVWAPDMVGNGESDRPDGAYDRPFYSGWLAEFLDAIRVQSAHVAGHSVGGGVALQFALEHRQRVRKLVLVDAAALGRGVPLAVALAFLRMMLFPSRAAAKGVASLAVHDPHKLDPLFEEFGQDVRAVPSRNPALWRGRRTVAMVTTDELRRVKPPTLIIWGREDRYFPVAHGARAAEAIPDARLQVIPQAGHVSFLDQPEAFCRAVLGFLGEAETQQPVGMR
jgi:4,5:9,10-diseco-3-hydroxy-5,9,17-trioxoandrosta-1(10),2-diene-4-oate hydrolase